MPRLMSGAVLPYTFILPWHARDKLNFLCILILCVLFLLLPFHIFFDFLLFLFVIISLLLLALVHSRSESAVKNERIMVGYK